MVFVVCTHVATVI